MAQDLPGGGQPRPAAPQPGRMVPRRPVLIVRPARLWVVVPQLVTVVIHYDGRRSFRCGYDCADGPCVGCEQGWARRVQNWTQVQDHGQRRPVTLFNITPGAILGCPRLEIVDGLLPWTLIETWREPRTPLGKQYVRILDAPPPTYLSPCQPTLAVLQALWSAPDRKEIVKSPRLFNASVEDEAPGVGDPANDFPPEGK